MIEYIWVLASVIWSINCLFSSSNRLPLAQLSSWSVVIGEEFFAGGKIGRVVGFQAVAHAGRKAIPGSRHLGRIPGDADFANDDRGEQGFAVFLHVLQNVVRFPFGIERLEDFQRGVVVLDDGIGVCCTGFAVRPAA